jgi:hypothetical protein
MPRFVYTVWFRDRTLPSDDQDHEWPACFIIDATTTALAQAWGDHLAKDYAMQREDEEFLSSSVVADDSSDTALLPVVAYGEVASDAKIGW